MSERVCCIVTMKHHHYSTVERFPVELKDFMLSVVLLSFLTLYELVHSTLPQFMCSSFSCVNPLRGCKKCIDTSKYLCMISL